MSQTPNSSETPYASPADFLECYAQSIVADMCRRTPNSPPPSYLALLDTNNPAGARLNKHLRIAAGQIEAACGVGRRYTKLDLQALTGVTQQLLVKMNCALGFWSLGNYLKPITARMEDVPGVKDSYELLDMLKNGELVFSTFEAQEAGLVHVNPANPYRLVTPNVVQVAQRLFVRQGQGWNGPWVGRGGNGYSG